MTRSLKFDMFAQTSAPEVKPFERDLFMPVLDFSETPKRGKETSRKSLKLVLGIGFISGVIAISSTLAANINLNSDAPVEFGQGVAQTTACSNGQSLIVTPLSSFTNNGGGSFNFTGVTVSDIPESCGGVDFLISAFNTSGDALSIFNTSSTVASIWNNNGTFQAGTGTQGVEIESNTGSFTINFTTPAALATNVTSVTLQSTKHANYNCVTDLVCQVGDTGPGGGTVFYVNDSGFNCGPNHTATGSPTGGKCNYLEAAPADWSGGEDPGRSLVPPAFTVQIPNLPHTNTINSTSELGLGYKYSNIIAAVSVDRTYAASRARDYNGGSRNDWYLPVTTELNQFCKYVSGQAWVSDATLCTGSMEPSPSFGIVLENQYWTSSGSDEEPKTAMVQYMGTGRQTAAYYTWTGMRIRPIRAF
jgi:hypothetical protein